MKLTHFAAMALAVLFVGSAFGQGLQQPASVRPSSLTSDYYYQDQEASPSDIRVHTTISDACGCDAVSTCDSCRSCCEPWRLFPELPGCFSLTGWLAAGGTGNGRPTPSRFNGPVTFNDRREVQFNQAYVVLERAIQEGCGWDWGARVDLLYGSDYIFTQATGLETRRDGTNKWNGHAHYGLALPQAYFELAYNDVSVKLGHFYTIMGYESVMAPSNFFYSHAYTMQYGEPFTHTGGLGEWKYSDRLTLWGGIVNGWDKFDATTNRAQFLGGFQWTPCHERYTFTGTLIAGDDDDNVGGQSSRYMYSLVFAYNVTNRLQYVLQHDSGRQNDFTGPFTPNIEWYGLNNYLFYTINDCWKAGLRFEWFRDDDGARVAGVRPGNPYGGGSVGNFYEVTAGLNWTPRSNLTIRPEIRWDWFDGAGTLPYNDGVQNDQFTAALDAILVW